MSCFDDTDDSDARQLWQERFGAYMGGQEGIEGLHSRVQPQPAMTGLGRPMLGYL